MTTDSKDARASLAAVSDAQRKLAAVTECPFQRHLAFGLVMGALTLAAGLGGPAQLWLTGGGFLSIAALAMWDRRRFGVFIYGYRRGPTLPLALILLGTSLAIVVAEIHARDAGLSLATKLVLAAVEVALATWVSLRVARIYRAELTGQL